MPADRGAEELLAVAEACIAAASVLDAERPRCRLLRRAVELSLKAALRIVGTRPEELARPPLDRDPAALLDRCSAIPEFGSEAAHAETIRALTTADASSRDLPLPGDAVAAATATLRRARRMLALWPPLPATD